MGGHSSRKKSTDSKTILDPSLLKVSEGDAAALQAEVKAINKQNAGVLLSKDPSNRFAFIPQNKRKNIVRHGLCVFSLFVVVLKVLFVPTGSASAYFSNLHLFFFSSSQ